MLPIGDMRSGLPVSLLLPADTVGLAPASVLSFVVGANSVLIYLGTWYLDPVRRWVIAGMLAGLSGCSFFMRGNPHGWEPSQPPTCTATRWPHALDILGGAATLTGPAMLVWVLADPEDCRNDVDLCQNFAVVGAAIAAVSVTYWAAALRGYRMANRCELARRRHHTWERHEEWRKKRKKRALVP